MTVDVGPETVVGTAEMHKFVGCEIDRKSKDDSGGTSGVSSCIIATMSALIHSPTVSQSAVVAVNIYMADSIDHGICKIQRSVDRLCELFRVFQLFAILQAILQVSIGMMKVK